MSFGQKVAKNVEGGDLDTEKLVDNMILDPAQLENISLDNATVDKNAPLRNVTISMNAEKMYVNTPTVNYTKAKPEIAKKKGLFAMRKPNIGKLVALIFSTLLLLPFLFHLVVCFTTDIWIQKSSGATPFLLLFFYGLLLCTAIKLFYGFVDAYWAEEKEIGEDKGILYFLTNSNGPRLRVFWTFCLVAITVMSIALIYDVRYLSLFLTRCSFALPIVVNSFMLCSICLDLFRFFIRVMQRIFLGVENLSDEDGIGQVLLFFLNWFFISLVFVSFLLVFAIYSGFESSIGPRFKMYEDGRRTYEEVKRFLQNA